MEAAFIVVLGLLLAGSQLAMGINTGGIE